jgi:hypothetical protein
VLLDRDENFVAFGYEALQRFSEMNEEELENHALYQRFKMQLMESVSRPIHSLYGDVNVCILKRVHRGMSSTSSQGMKAPLMKLFTMVIQFFKDHFMEAFNTSHGRWVHQSIVIIHKKPVSCFCFAFNLFTCRFLHYIKIYFIYCQELDKVLNLISTYFILLQVCGSVVCPLGDHSSRHLVECSKAVHEGSCLQCEGNSSMKE